MILAFIIILIIIIVVFVVSTLTASHVLRSKLIMNTEWFFTEEEFIVFWKYYQKNWWRFGWYKILIRHCKADEFPHSPCYQRNVYAIDIVAFRFSVLPMNLSTRTVTVFMSS